MKSKEKSKKKFAITLRGILTLLFLVTFGISIYLVFYSEGDKYTEILLSVFASLVLFNCTIVYYTIQPFSPFRKSPFPDSQNGRYPALTSVVIFILLFICLAWLLPQTIIVRNSYRPALFFIAAGIGFSAAFIVITLINIKSTNHNKKVIGPIRIWQISLLLYASIGIFTWYLADWNPVLRHAEYEVEITRSVGFPRNYLGRICDLDVGWLLRENNRYKCRARMFYGTKRIYGKLGEGAFNCRIIKNKESAVEIVGADNSLKDGDPVFIINTYRKYVLFKRYTSGNKVVSLEGRILLD